jgi:HEAT repeat protein
MRAAAEFAAGAQKLHRVFALLGDPVGRVRRAALEALATVDPAFHAELVTRAIDSLDQPNPQRIAHALTLLRRLGAREALPEVRELLADLTRDLDSPLLRTVGGQAACYLGEFGDGSDAENMSALLDLEDRKAWLVRRGVSWALGQLGHRAAAGRVSARLGHLLRDIHACPPKWPEVRTHAATLEALKGSEWLLGHAQRSFGVRLMCIKALGRLCPDEAGPRLLPMLASIDASADRDLAGALVGLMRRSGPVREYFAPRLESVAQAQELAARLAESLTVPA